MRLLYKGKVVNGTSVTVVKDQGPHVHIQVEGGVTGWVKRENLEMPMPCIDALAAQPAAAAAAAPPMPAAKPGHVPKPAAAAIEIHSVEDRASHLIKRFPD